MRLLAEQTNLANVLINLWPSNSKGEIMHLWLSFSCSYCDKLSRYDSAFNYSAWTAMRMQLHIAYSVFQIIKVRTYSE